VLSRFVASSTQPGAELAEEEEEAPTSTARGGSVAEPPAAPRPPTGRIGAAPPSATPSVDTAPSMAEAPSAFQETAVEDLATAEINPRIDSPAAQTLGQGRASDLAGRHGASFHEISQQISAAPAANVANPIEELPAASASFDISALQPEEQDLHRRANRVAKVSMQDIKMLRPNDVRLGREHKDICVRLRDDIEKAHKEYDRRFQSILVHPVDYFYDWMVEILGEGDAEALGEYPYPSPVLRR
jgi:hypothetical protein